MVILISFNAWTFSTFFPHFSFYNFCRSQPHEPTLSASMKVKKCQLACSLLQPTWRNGERRVRLYFNQSAAVEGFANCGIISLDRPLSITALSFFLFLGLAIAPRGSTLRGGKTLFLTRSAQLRRLQVFSRRSSSAICFSNCQASYFSLRESGPEALSC